MTGPQIPEKFFISLITTMNDENGNPINTINNFVKTLYVVRNLIEQTSPYMVLTIELDMSTLVVIEELLLGSREQFPTGKLYITACDDENFTRDQNEQPSILDSFDIYFDYLVITHCVREESLQRASMNVTLTLVNKQFFNMKNSYIIAKSGIVGGRINAADFIKDNYMSFISKKYCAFILNNINFPSTNQQPYSVANNYVYDAFPLDSNVCDLDIPAHIIQRYKPINVPSYWFFDDFYMDKDVDTSVATGGIMCHWLTFFKAASQFKRIDISSKWDANKQFNILGTEAISDNLGLLKEISTIDVCARFANMSYSKADVNFGGNDVIKSKSIMSALNMVDATTILVNNRIDESYSSSGTVSPMKFDVPENDKTMKNLYSRISLSHFYANYSLQEIQFYEFPLCLPNIFQFGEIYNLEGYDVSGKSADTYISTGMDKNYTLTPCCIINVFRSIGEKSQHLEPSSYVKFLRINSIDLDGTF